MQEITMLELYHLVKENTAPAEGTFKAVNGTDEEYAQYQAEREFDRRDFEARMEARKKIKHVLCANCGHECGVHTLFQTCREKTSTGKMFCNCPDFIPVE